MKNFNEIPENREIERILKEVDIKIINEYNVYIIEIARITVPEEGIEIFQPDTMEGSAFSSGQDTSINPGMAIVSYPRHLGKWKEGYIDRLMSIGGREIFGVEHIFTVMDNKKFLNEFLKEYQGVKNKAFDSYIKRYSVNQQIPIIIQSVGGIR